MLAKIINLGVVGGIVGCILIVMSGLIPQSFLQAEKDAIIYFLTFLNYLNPIIEVSVLLSCIQALVNFFFWVAVFYIMLWLSNLFI